MNDGAWTIKQTRSANWHLSLNNFASLSEEAQVAGDRSIKELSHWHWRYSYPEITISNYIRKSFVINLLTLVCNNLWNENYIHELEYAEEYTNTRKMHNWVGSIDQLKINDFLLRKLFTFVISIAYAFRDSDKPLRGACKQKVPERKREWFLEKQVLSVSSFVFCRLYLRVFYQYRLNSFTIVMQLKIIVF